MLTLPEEHRGCFRRPFGVLYSSVDDLLPELKNRPVYAVGDVVTHNLLRRGVMPDVAIIDGYTMRVPCNRSPLLPAGRVTVKNPAGTLTGELIDAIMQAIAHPPAVIFVDGEEDLAVIPVVIAAPMGAAVLYGQPKEGIVLRTVDEEAKAEAERLLGLFVEA